MAEKMAQSVIVTLSSGVGEIISALTEFQKLKIDLKHLESRPAKCNDSTSDSSGDRGNARIDYFIEFVSPSRDLSDVLMANLKKIALKVSLLSVVMGPEKPWFPQHISTLHRCCTNLFKYGEQLSPDHPGYGDSEYVERRKVIAQVANDYTYGDRIPRIEYTQQEIKTWGEVFRNQTKLYSTHACKEYNHSFPGLFSACGYREDNIPQLEDVSQYLRAQTGWQLWPVLGWITSRDFLNALAFRVFPTSQFIRHHSSPLYTPEPDICHELMGHAPLFCDPCFAQFSQEIGLASLGISDEWIEKLASLYWYTVEFGMVEENGSAKAYGAGLLSSCQELQHCVSDTPERHAFEIEKAIATTHPETGLQPLYFVAESIEDMRNKLIDFSKHIPRDFALNYDPYTQSITVLDSTKEVEKLAKEVQHQATLLHQSITKLNS